MCRLYLINLKLEKMKLAITFNKRPSNDSIGFLGLLAIVFITLKLCKIITWSWWWVLAPLWCIPALFVAIILFWLLMMILFALFEK